MAGLLAGWVCERAGGVAPKVVRRPRALTWHQRKVPPLLMLKALLTHWGWVEVHTMASASTPVRRGG